jgi:hypothetical protein
MKILNLTQHKLVSSWHVHVIYLYVVILQFCTVHPWKLFAIAYDVVMYYSSVMNLYPNGFEIDNGWKNHEYWAYLPFKHLIVMRLQCIVCFQNPLKQTSTFLVKFPIKVKYNLTLY